MKTLATDGHLQDGPQQQAHFGSLNDTHSGIALNVSFSQYNIDKHSHINFDEPKLSHLLNVLGKSVPGLAKEGELIELLLLELGQLVQEGVVGLLGQEVRTHSLIVLNLLDSAHNQRVFGEVNQHLLLHLDRVWVALVHKRQVGEERTTSERE